MASDRPVDGFEKASFANSSAAPSGFHHAETGLTKRELFAAMAMQGMLGQSGGTVATSYMATLAINHADALIAELCK